jgi:phage N-6-adenine-methyltransferase
MNELVKGQGKRGVALYDPERGLKTIAVAEAAEKAAIRAVRADPGDPLARKRLRNIIEVKLIEQRDYVVWRDEEMKPRSRGSGANQVNRAPAVHLPAFDPGQDIADRWRKALVKKDFDAALKDAQHRGLRVCEQANGNTTHRTAFTGNFEWYTPADYVERARRVLGVIDLDPASSALAQATIRATRYFSEEDDGLKHEWRGKVWLNPPYAQPDIELFVDKLLLELSAGRVTEAILLTHNHSDTIWFQKAATSAATICFTRSRILFESPTGEVANPTQGQAFLYFGDNVERFAEVFRPIGFVAYLAPPELAALEIETREAGGRVR